MLVWDFEFQFHLRMANAILAGATETMETYYWLSKY